MFAHPVRHGRRAGSPDGCPNASYVDRESGTPPYGCLELEATSGGDEVSPETEKRFARRVAGDLGKRWADLCKNDYVLITGGGAIRLYPYFQEHYPVCHITSDPITANVRGLRKLGIIHERQRQAGAHR
jgi:hypothetical protein